MQPNRKPLYDSTGKLHSESAPCGDVINQAEMPVRPGWSPAGKLAIIDDLGRVMSNDSGVITERGPDRVRGADVCYYSFERLPKGPLEKGYRPEVPELVVEVRSSSDRWRDIHVKITEYLSIGVLVVVLDLEPRTAHVFGADDPPRTLGAEEELVLPGVLEGFRVRVGQFFE